MAIHYAGNGYGSLAEVDHRGMVLVRRRLGHLSPLRSALRLDAVNDPRGLAPEGWHMLTDAEWEAMGNVP